MSEQLEEILDLGAQPWGNDFIKIEKSEGAVSYPLRLFFCHSCSMVQIDYTVAKEKMFVDHAYMSGTTKSLKNHFVEIGKMIVDRYGSSDGRVMDIGGNDGTFLEFFHERGMKVLNVESGDRQSKDCKRKGIDTVHKFFNYETAKQIIAEYGRMSVVHGSGVLFHLEELHSAFGGIELILDDNGVLIAEFIYLPSMVQNCAYDQIYHEHLVYYSLISLQGLLTQFGLEIFDASLVPIHGGSCVAHVSREGVREKTEALETLLAKEFAAGVDKVDLYRAFAANSQLQRDNMRKLVAKLKSEGKSIQALGAPVKGSTIINFCGLTDEHIECAVEINPHKFGTYIPGTNISVVDESMAEQPDVYLLLAWNFIDEILPKFADFRAKGGKFIVPIPTPNLI
jgi:hypothetical protein